MAKNTVCRSCGKELEEEEKKYGVCMECDPPPDIEEPPSFFEDCPPRI